MKHKRLSSDFCAFCISTNREGIFSHYFIMDFLQNQWQTLGEKVSSIFNPSSVLEDVVSAQDNVPVQKSMPSANRPASVDPKVKSEHKCTCGGH